MRERRGDSANQSWFPSAGVMHSAHPIKDTCTMLARECVSSSLLTCMPVHLSASRQRQGGRGRGGFPFNVLPSVAIKEGPT